MSKYGEPWRESDYDGRIYSPGNRVMATAENGNEARIVACVNALAGVADPAAALARIKELMREFADEPCWCDDYISMAGRGKCRPCDYRAALAALGGEAKP